MLLVSESVAIATFKLACLSTFGATPTIWRQRGRVALDKDEGVVKVHFTLAVRERPLFCQRG